MIDVDRSGFFTMLKENKKWDYSPAEQEEIWKGLPNNITYDQLKTVVLNNTKKAQPTGQTLIKFGWSILKKNKKKKETRKNYEGCGNCNYGYFKFPDIDRHMDSKYIYNIVNLTNIGMFPHKELRCNCTNHDNYVAHFKKLTDLYFIDQSIYEFCYLAWYYYLSAFINDIRFKNFDEFNPFQVYGYAEYEDCHLLRKDDLKYYQHVIGRVPRKPKVKVKVPESTLRRIPVDMGYNKQMDKKYYEEA